MAASEPTSTKIVQKPLEDEVEQPQLTMPKEMWFGFPLQLYQGFWCLSVLFDSVVGFQNHFEAYDTDIILASMPKTGTTWLKSLLYAIVNRKNVSDVSQLPFHAKHPHELVPHFEIEVYKNINETKPDLTQVPLPRLFATHMPYSSLPISIKTSNSRFVYVCRNPLDTFVSMWHFYLQFDISKGIKPDMKMMEEYIDKYCTGVSPFGPYEDHVLGYWNEYKQNQQKVLFLEYEGLKKQPKDHIKRLAEFVGLPFSEEEEEERVIDEIIKLCSLQNLKEKEVNESGKFYSWVENKAFFRKGEVGDWTNHLTTSMAKRFDKILGNLEDAGFSFTFFPSKIQFEA